MNNRHAHRSNSNIKVTSLAKNDATKKHVCKPMWAWKGLMGCRGLCFSKRDKRKNSGSGGEHTVWLSMGMEDGQSSLLHWAHCTYYGFGESLLECIWKDSIKPDSVGLILRWCWGTLFCLKVCSLKRFHESCLVLGVNLEASQECLV